LTTDLRILILRAAIANSDERANGIDVMGEY